jgi:hypothetical protein
MLSFVSVKAREIFLRNAGFQMAGPESFRLG